MSIRNDIVSGEHYTCPINLNETNSATVNAAWFVSDKRHPRPPAPREATFLPLNCGEKAFDAVHRAIADARSSVDIICWGFQPSMYFIRDGKHPCIGKLLEQKAQEDHVRIRVLGWSMEILGFNATGFAGESNAPGRALFKTSDRPITSSDEQYEYDKYWYLRYERRMLNRGPFATCNAERPGLLDFIGRSFNPTERLEIMWRAAWRARDTISTKSQGVLAATATHHQKMVLVDYDLPDRAVGFVMGHNMLDEYWDTTAHSRQRFTAGNLGRNGQGPRQDISSRVTGPILHDLHDNFASAWHLACETRYERDNNSHANQPRPLLPAYGTPCMAQLLRTQSQQKHRDIEKLYLNAVNNATRYIYIENQYFRWPPLAEKITTVARQLAKGGCPHPLHLFVVTNASDEGIGAGTVKTYQMLEALGRADVIPAVARLEKTDDLHARLEHANNEVRRNESVLPNLQVMRNGQLPPVYDKQLAIIAASKARRDALARELKRIKKPDSNIFPESRPGLKVHICTLVAPDSLPPTPDGKYVRMKYPMSAEAVPIPGRKWIDVYVHSKLMIIDDTFMTLGSANINTRSMQVDSELNIAHQNAEISRKLRLELWQQHTNGKGAQLATDKAFKEWGDVIKNNKNARFSGKAPVASLVEFHRDSPKRSNLD